ncbi:hypothetical protein, partial [Streptomyces sp. NPDC005989]|uniref:hypothetical protein n=1 Tax=Streptomyces sp. NPDC005989 TaxID=3156727 RepID=UPI0034061099
GPAFIHQPHPDHPIKTRVQPTNPLIGKRMTSENFAQMLGHNQNLRGASTATRNDVLRMAACDG